MYRLLSEIIRSRTNTGRVEMHYHPFGIQIIRIRGSLTVSDPERLFRHENVKRRPPADPAFSPYFSFVANNDPSAGPQ